MVERLDAGSMAPGSVLGRYVVLRQVGEAVYAAHDQELDRMVALRVLGGEAELARVRDVAAVSHPNLVAVHDVGEQDGVAFVATEFVNGTTLGAWMKERSPDWRQVRTAFESIARGLQAAHAAGLVSGRDPRSAVLWGQGGAVQVGDLRASRDASEHDDDQRRFGEALCEGLGREAPAALRRIGERAVGVGFVDFNELASALADLAPRHRPTWMVPAAAAGGLATLALVFSGGSTTTVPACAPAERKLEQIWDEQRRARIEDAFAATSLPFAGHASGEVVRTLDAYAASWLDMQQDACEATHLRRQQSTRVLDLRMACLERRLDELGALTNLLAQADPTIVERSVQAAQALVNVETCGDLDTLTADVPPPSDPQTQLEVDRIRAELSRLKALSDAGKFAEGARASAAVVAGARDTGYPAVVAEALRRQGSLQAAAGEPDTALETLRAAVHVAWEGGHDRMAARAWLDLSHVAGEDLSQWALAERYLHHAEAAVDRVGGDESLRADLGFARATVLNGQGRYEAAIREYESLLEVQRRLGNEDAVASIHNNIALAQHAFGQHDEALRNFSIAAEEWARKLGPQHPAMATVHNNIGSTHYARGELEKARDEMWQGYEIRRVALGPDHSRVAESLNNVGVVEFQLGRFEEAEAHQRESLAIREAAVGPDHPDIAPTVLTLGRILHMRGESEQARENWKRALALTEAGHGPDHPYVAAVEHAVGDMLEEDRSYAEALEHRRRALRIEENAFGPGHPEVAQALRLVAQDLVALDRDDEALGPARRSVQVLEGAEDSVSLARSRFVLAQAMYSRPQDRTQALELARKAEPVLRGADRLEDADRVRDWLARRTETSATSH